MVFGLVGVGGWSVWLVQVFSLGEFGVCSFFDVGRVVGLWVQVWCCWVWRDLRGVWVGGFVCFGVVEVLVVGV